MAEVVVASLAAAVAASSVAIEAEIGGSTQVGQRHPVAVAA